MIKNKDHENSVFRQVGPYENYLVVYDTFLISACESFLCIIKLAAALYSSAVMKVNIEDLKHWPILNYLPASFLKNVRLVYVYGECFNY